MINLNFHLYRYTYDTVIQGFANKTSIASCQNPMAQSDYSNAHIPSSDDIGTGNWLKQNNAKHLAQYVYDRWLFQP